MSNTNALPEPVDPSYVVPIQGSRKLPRPTSSSALTMMERYGVSEIAEIRSAEKASIKAAKVRADEAEMEVLRDISRRHRSGELSQRDLARIYISLRTEARAGFPTRWDSVIDFKRLSIECHAFSEPHTDGRWYGRWPLVRGMSVPEPGQAVLYYLYDGNDVCCYIGSSGNLKTRLKNHWSTGKIFEKWMAEPHSSREAAYVAEDVLLRSIPLPYYNERVGR